MRLLRLLPVLAVSLMAVGAMAAPAAAAAAVTFTPPSLTFGSQAVGTTSPQDALQKIRLGGCRAVIADFKMPAMDGLAFLEKVLQYDPGIYVILVTGYYSVDTAIDAIKRSAYD